ncbi:Pirin [Hondaea fermentalgiana]|uniref:Pirin n=1 Tax=Hondaea fermentalgiana TaxID=2315210 RepID=A0A2R5GNE1_9STRA|nr:Pirin [Hondaea fermentalgiana]|eukprot:GBG31258.1 Pirin [Hondaea fermentalgiana]
MKAVRKVRAMTGGPMETASPYLFVVYHKDEYPAGNSKMEHPSKVGNGMDFDQRAKYRMYHGEKVPGFPAHPHRGFETITATIEGVIDHADSLKNGGRYGMGDLQWMTAGSGIQHSEMFPLLHDDKPNKTRFFQIWLNLPSASKMVPPAFEMHWAHEVRSWQSEDGKSSATVWCGDFKGVEAFGKPPRDSYAANPASKVGIFHISIAKGGTLELDPAVGDRNLYMVEGSKSVVGGKRVERGIHAAYIETEASVPVQIECPNSDCEFLVLQGRPIAEPVVQHGPFVMNTQQEIVETVMDYRRTQFGGWPYDRPDVVFPREKGRFAMLNGVETAPPDNEILD